ncbi:MAG: DUF3080 family protein [Halioglobus sp.]
MNADRGNFKTATAFVLGLALLAGCAEKSPDAPFQVYLDRLGRTLDVKVESPAAHRAVPRSPRPGKLRLGIPTDKLGTLDFMDLRGCELQVTIGKANSSLGRLARDSQKLLLALEYLNLAPNCITMLQAEGELELANKLQQAQAHKTTVLPALIYNATLASEEFQALWRPTPVTTDYPANTSSAVITALNNISQAANRWLAGNYEANNLKFELLLSEVSRGDAGQLWRALAHQGQWLDAANTILAQRLQRGPLCQANLRPQAADILPNVVRKYFVDAIQPRAAVLGRRYHQVLPPVLTLEKRLLTSLPSRYLDWSEDRNSAFSALNDKPKQHVRQLQKVLTPCQGNP